MSQAAFKAHMHKAVISNFLINVAINAGIAWWLLEQHETLVAWRAPAYGPDLVITGFLLCAIIAAIAMETSRRQAARGELSVDPESWPSFEVLSHLGRAKLTALAGVTGAVASALLAFGVALSVTSMSVLAYAGVKGLWAGLLAAAVVGPAMVIGTLLGASTGASPGR